MTRHYSPTRRELYRAAESKRRTITLERAQARNTKRVTTGQNGKTS